MPVSTPIRRVAITGLGAVTPVGLTAPATWAALIAGTSGIGPITRFDATGCTARIAGEVRGFDPTAARATALYPRGAGTEPVTAALSPKDVRKLGRFSHLGLGAGLEAYADSGLDGVRDRLPAERIGVNLGVGLGGLPEIVATHETWRTGGFRKISPFFILQAAPNILAGQLAILLNCRGPNFSIASACATSGHTLGESARAIRRGDADVMLAGGAEAVITQVAVGAFAQMKALSTRNDAPRRPRGRMTPTATDSWSGRAPSSSSLRRWSTPSGAGPGLRRATGIRRHSGRPPPLVPRPRGRGLPAVDAAGPRRLRSRCRAIGYVSAHATSTPSGDGEEASAIAAVFAGSRDRLHVSAVKSMTGHLLGAAGALGALAAVLAIDRGVVPPTVNLDNVDPACAALGLNFTAAPSVTKAVEASLANSFGFGGTNASLVFGRAGGTR